ncbi:MAG: hypothetical protein GX803_05880 [Lentisphaerae bacterium]|jgi:hypothetical protein|nr:hypothetical protein [Lentisphaerota bacterium]
MAPRLPTPEELAAFQARARLRDRAEHQRLDARKTVMRLILFFGGFLVLVALIVDIRHYSGRFHRFQRTGTESRKGDAADILAGLDDPRYQDPGGLFSLVPPRHWVRVRPEPGSGFQTVFKGPHNMDMAIMVAVSNNATFDSLVADLRRIERQLSANMPMEITFIGPHRAIKRSAQLFKNKVLLIDFLTGNLAHHIQFSIPPELFDEYEPVFVQLLQTYEPGRIIRDP